MRRIVFLAFVLLMLGGDAARAQWRRCTPVDDGRALRNPGMGWTMHFYSNKPENYGSRLAPEDVVSDFPGLTTVYLRLPWSFIEPEEGVYNWEMLDTPAQRWIDAGCKVAFRITATENWTRTATPQWVFDAGARCYEVDNYLEPDYADSIFLEKMECFVRAMAGRYDGNPNVAFVDIGHFGMWGEGHTVVTTPKHGREWGIETQKAVIDIYCRHFKHTQLCISDDFAGHDAPVVHSPVIDYALSRGVTLRDDSILVQPPPRHWYHAGMAGLFWPTMPVILEHDHYKESERRGAWSGSRLLQAVEEYHASYMSVHWWPREELEENRAAIDSINRRLGYRLLLSRAEWPMQVRQNETFAIRYAMRNAGVAPCYGGGFPCFTLKNDRGGIVSVLVDKDFDVRRLTTAKPGAAPDVEGEMTANVARIFRNAFGTFGRACPSGRFGVYFSVGTADGTPVYELPYPDSDGRRRYRLGTIDLLPPAE